MKKLLTLFRSLFNQNKMEQKTTEVQVNAYSQPHVLQHWMREEKLTHGQTVKADISPVRIEVWPKESCSKFSGNTYLYFCPAERLDIKEKITDGDGGALPSEAILKGINVPAETPPGLYSLKNVTLFSNGTLQVIANEDTKFEPYEPVQNETITTSRRFTQELRYRQAQREITMDMLSYERPVFVPSRFE